VPFKTSFIPAREPPNKWWKRLNNLSRIA
jgi:hypothetical protein